MTANVLFCTILFIPESGVFWGVLVSSSAAGYMVQNYLYVSIFGVLVSSSAAGYMVQNYFYVSIVDNNFND